MPFDALEQSIITDELATIGITPVPAEVLKRHKQNMLNQHRTFARWQTIVLDKDRLTEQLARVDQLSLMLPRLASAPWRVRRLAERVHAAIPEARFTLGYFYRDPYLSVHYGDKKACLAIWWHRFRLAAIAIDRQTPWLQLR